VVREGSRVQMACVTSYVSQKWSTTVTVELPSVGVSNEVTHPWWFAVLGG